MILKKSCYKIFLFAEKWKRVKLFFQSMGTWRTCQFFDVLQAPDIFWFEHYIFTSSYLCQLLSLSFFSLNAAGNTFIYVYLWIATVYSVFSKSDDIIFDTFYYSRLALALVWINPLEKVRGLQKLQNLQKNQNKNWLYYQEKVLKTRLHFCLNANSFFLFLSLSPSLLCSALLCSALLLTQTAFFFSYYCLIHF